MNVITLAGVVVISVSTLTGCASYSFSSNVDSAQSVSVGLKDNVIITEKSYQSIWEDVNKSNILIYTSLYMRSVE
jgi:hypothetical protein